MESLIDCGEREDGSDTHSRVRLPSVALSGTEVDPRPRTNAVGLQMAKCVRPNIVASSEMGSCVPAVSRETARKLARCGTDALLSEQWLGPTSAYNGCTQYVRRERELAPFNEVCGRRAG